MNVHTPTAAHNAKPIVAKDSAFAVDVLHGLTQEPKRLSPKYFYDDAGSDLFEQITRLPEYYPTRTELGILRTYALDIAAAIPREAALIEFGAGSTTKVRLLLEAAPIKAYVPVDISGDFVATQAAALRADFPNLAVYPVHADFTQPFELPEDVRRLPKVGFFPGSTLGNFEPHEAARFLRQAATLLGHGATLIVGIDLEKDERVLHAAYNDAAGVTAAFNKNLLVRMNRELGANFDLSSFVHRAIYNRDLHRIEMHLVSRKAQTVQVCGRTIQFRAGESIHTENSYKFTPERFRALANGAGWSELAGWRDDAGLFALVALRAI